MNHSTQVASSRNPHTRPRPRIGCWRRLLAASLALGFAAVLQTARADSVIYLNNFNNASNNLANNSDGIGSGFTAFTLDKGLSFYVIDAFETNSYAMLATSLIGDQTASLDTINPFNLNGGGTTFELSGVSFFTNTPIPNGGGGAAGAVDRLIWGVSTIAPAGNWLTNGPPGAIPTGFWIQFNSDSLVTGTGQGGWSGTSTLFYKDVGTNVYRLCSWTFDNLKWSSAGPNNFAPVLDVKLTLSGTGWALNITGDTATNNPISYSGTYANGGILSGTTNLVAIQPLLFNGVNSSYLGGFSQDTKPGIAMQIDQAKVTQLGTLVVTTPQFNTPEYGFNTNAVLAGEAVTLSSTVADSVGTPTLQWQIEDMSNPGAFTNLPSGNLTNVNVDTSGFGGSVKGIRLVATDGATVVNSPEVTLTVNPASAPVIAQDTTPSYENLDVGQPGLLKAAFWGNLPISCNWQKSPDGSTWTNIPRSINPTATNNTLVIASAQLTDGGYYRLFASNSVGTSASSTALIAMIPGTPQYLWSAPIPFAGLNADQILTNFPSTNKIAGAMFATNGGLPLVVTTSLGNIVFGANGVSSIGVGGFNGYGTGASSNQTGNASFNTCLNNYVYDNTNHFIAMSNLVVGQTYQVQLFGLDDRYGKTTHLANWQDLADTNDVSLTYKMGDNVHFLGTFVASDTVQVIQQNLVDTNNDGLGNFNCVILRAVGWNPPPYFVYQPQNKNAFLGQSVSIFGVAADDASLGAVSCQWMAGPHGGPYTNLVEGAKYNGTTTTILTISNLTAADGVPVYVLAASNNVGSQNSREMTLVVQTAPHGIVNGSYAATALSNRPVALWMLDENNDPSTGLVQAYDYTGNGHNGVYGTASLNGFDGQQGPQPPAYPGFYAGETAFGVVSNSASSIVTLPPLNDTNLATTVAMWIKPTDNGGYACGLIGGRNNYVAGQIWQLGYSAGSGDLGYNWNDNSATYTYNSRLAPVVGTWNFVALVITSNDATFYLYYLNGSGQAILQKVVNAVANVIPVTMAGGTSIIGSDPYSVASRAFNGSIAGVALYNSALSESQLQAMFGVGVGMTGSFPPAFMGNPVITTGPNGSQFVLTWSFGTLLQATNAAGPWTPTGATSPYTNFLNLTAPNMFNKLSNP